MAKIDIRNELTKRKYRVTNKFYYWIYHTLMHVPEMKYNAHYERIDDVSKCEGSCFVIFNHLSRIDHNYVMQACYPKKIGRAHV